MEGGEEGGKKREARGSEENERESWMEKDWEGVDDRVMAEFRKRKKGC